MDDAGDVIDMDPRAATSVATSVCSLPARKAASVRSRSAWLRSPCIAAAAAPASFNPRATRSAPCLVRTKTTEDPAQ